MLNFLNDLLGLFIFLGTCENSAHCENWYVRDLASYCLIVPLKCNLSRLLLEFSF